MNDLTKNGGKESVPPTDTESSLLLIKRLVESHIRHSFKGVDDVRLDEYTRRLSRTAWATILGFGKVGSPVLRCIIVVSSETRLIRLGVGDHMS